MAQRKMQMRDATPETIANTSNRVTQITGEQQQQSPPGAANAKMGGRPGSASICGRRRKQAVECTREGADCVRRCVARRPQEVRRQQEAGKLDPAAMPFPGRQHGNTRPHGGSGFEFGDEFGALSLKPQPMAADLGGASGSASMLGGVGAAHFGARRRQRFRLPVPCHFRARHCHHRPVREVASRRPRRPSLHCRRFSSPPSSRLSRQAADAAAADGQPKWFPAARCSRDAIGTGAPANLQARMNRANCGRYAAGHPFLP